VQIKKLKFFEVVVGGLLLAASASAGPVVVVNFETVPSLPTGPSLFGGPEQDIVVPGVATFRGGTILGFAANFRGLYSQHRRTSTVPPILAEQVIWKP